MGLFSRKKDTPKKQWPSVIKNASISGDMICLHGEQDFCTKSTLIVQPGEEALFVKNGVVEKVFTNGTYELTTENYPVLQRLIRLFTDGDSTFNCRVYFVRVASSVEIGWGTGDPIQIEDENDITTHVKANGTYRVQVGDSRLFLDKIIGNGMTSFSTSEIKKYFNGELLTKVKNNIAVVIENNLGNKVMKLASHQEEISKLVGEKLKESFAEYGVELLQFSVSTITAEVTEERRMIQQSTAESIAYRNKETQKINMKKAEMDALGTNWLAQQQVDVLKTMAENPGSNAMSSAANMGMGFAVGTAAFGMGQQAMGQQMQYQAAPPPPVNSWFIYVNGQQMGPMTIAQIQQYVSAGQFARTDLVWKEGYQSWVPAANVPELGYLFAQVPPAPPVPPTPPVPPVK